MCETAAWSYAYCYGRVLICWGGSIRVVGILVVFCRVGYGRMMSALVPGVYRACAAKGVAGADGCSQYHTVVL